MAVNTSTNGKSLGRNAAVNKPTAKSPKSHLLRTRFNSGKASQNMAVTMPTRQQALAIPCPPKSKK